MLALIFAAAAPSVAERLKGIPAHFWLRIGLVVLAIIAVVFVWRKIAGANKVIVTVVAGLVLSFVGFNWIYQRDEPAWASPAVNWLGGFLPTKAAVAKKAGQ